MYVARDTVDTVTIPLKCTDCGEWFASGWLQATDSNVTFKDCTVTGPHDPPRCYGDGIIADGQYNFTRRGVEAILDAGLSEADVRSLTEGLKLIHGAQSYAEVVRGIEEAVPDEALRSALLDLLDKLPGKEDVALTLSVLSLIVGLLSLYVGVAAKSEAHEDAVAARVEAHEDAVAAQKGASADLERFKKQLPGLIEKAMLDYKPPQRRAKPPVSRPLNQKCPCGSGKKYKKCHGLKAAE